MKKLIGLHVFVLFLITIMTGCVHAPFVPPQGLAFSNTAAPLDLEFEDTEIDGSKTGKADVICILGLITFGDASSKTAAANGGITTIDHADYEHLNVLGIFQKTTVIVYGD